MVRPLLSTTCVVKVMSSATPVAFVTAIPDRAPSPSLTITLVPSTASPSALTVTSSSLILFRTPVELAVTVEVSIVPSMKSIVEEPVIVISLVFAIVTSVRVKSPEPPASIPTLLLEIVIPLIDTGSCVFGPYLNAAPAELATVPVKSPPRSLV